jgi:hypothetical protein
MPIEEIGFIAVEAEPAENLFALLWRKQAVCSPSCTGLVEPLPMSGTMVGNTAHPLATASEIISHPARLASLSHRRIHARKYVCLLQWQISRRPTRNCIMAGSDLVPVFRSSGVAAQLPGKLLQCPDSTPVCALAPVFQLPDQCSVELVERLHNAVRSWRIV